MSIQVHTKADVIAILQVIKERVTAPDSQLIAALQQSSAAAASSLEEIHTGLITDLERAIAFVSAEAYEQGEAFHSRNPLAGLAQAHISETANEAPHNSVGDALPAVVNLFGQGNPLVWAPVMVNILLEHLKPKADFLTATDKLSLIKIPSKCTIALLGDWGADNDHAQRIADLVKDRKPDYAVHLGDIYYAGTDYECERFLANWPLQEKGKSFALNGNHEMYSRGIPYFGKILPAFGQEASYFTLYNDDWQLHGLDTAYVPFSLDGNVEVPEAPNFWHRVVSTAHHVLPFLSDASIDRRPDARLQSQWKWLVDKLSAHPGRKNIFLSHNQPLSAYLPEFQAGAFLFNEFWKLRELIPAGADIVYAWFFGHEHKCTIYADDKTEFRARLIGNGAIPHSRQAMVAAAKDETNTSCTPVYTMNDRVVKHDALGLRDLDLAISGFALLTLDGANAFVEYINEDGTLFLKEKLSGKPNEVLEWGQGYGPLKKH